MDMRLKNAFLLLSLFGTISASPIGDVDTRKCPKSNGLFPKPGSFCKSYYKCKRWTPEELTCPPDQNFNAIKGWCDWEELYPCLEKPTRKECPRPNGRFLKPGTKCKIYFDCCNGNPTEKRCPKDQLFDPSSQNCEWPELYRCVEDILTQELTTPHPFSSTFVTSETTGAEISSTLKTSVATFSEEIHSPSSIHDILSSTTTAPIVSEETTSETITVDTTPSSDISDIMSSLPPGSTASEITYSPSEISAAMSSDTTFSKLIHSSSSISDFMSSSTPGSTFSELIQSPSDISDITSSSSPDSTFSELIQSPSDISHATRSTSSISPISELSPSPSIISDTYSSVTPNIMCPEPNGYFPHPTDKHKFIGCVNNIPTILTCPSNLIYNHKVRRCVYK